MTSPGLAEDVAVEPLRIDNGHVDVPDRPGLGIDVDERRVRRRQQEFRKSGVSRIRGGYHAGFDATKRMSFAAACAVASALFTAPAMALEKVKLSLFQSNFCCFAVYVAKHLKLFEKHGVDVELIYGTGIQPANIFVSGSADAGAFAVEHGVTVSSKGKTSS